LQIWLHVADEDVDAADASLREVERLLHLLAEHPKAGPARPELRPRLRSYPVGSYLIF
jgi:toxin ParE1/3/4